jgi:hypothetical protein
MKYMNKNLSTFFSTPPVFTASSSDEGVSSVECKGFAKFSTVEEVFHLGSVSHSEA